ncbi:MAG TPA: NfeD family protein [Acidimicrobiia bacterium]|nr:NfeD family protein [Acidimicrobiia bacterium]
MTGDVARIAADCDRYWRENGVPRSARTQMRLELEQHLAAAAAEGRPATAVTGPNIERFAQEWAAAQGHGDPKTSWYDIQSGEADFRRMSRRTAITYGLGMLALMAGVIAGSLAQGGDDVDNETWRWVWTLLAIGMGIGEIFTAGFFLLPFAIGAAAAAVLSWLGVALLAQWLVFFGVSAIAFAYLRKFIDRQDLATQPRVGANRWLEATGVVLVDIDTHGSVGMVRIDTEEWRAISEDGSPITSGTRVIVTDVQGSRLVVTPLGDQ